MRIAYTRHYQVEHPGESTSIGGRDGTMAVWADEEVLKQYIALLLLPRSFLFNAYSSRVKGCI